MSKLLKMDIDADEGALLHTTTALIAAGEMSNHPRRSKSRSWVAACATAQTSGREAGVDVQQFGRRREQRPRRRRQRPSSVETVMHPICVRCSISLGQHLYRSLSQLRDLLRLAVPGTRLDVNGATSRSSTVDSASPYIRPL